MSESMNIYKSSSRRCRAFTTREAIRPIEELGPSACPSLSFTDMQTLSVAASRRFYFRAVATGRNSCSTKPHIVASSQKDTTLWTDNDFSCGTLLLRSCPLLFSKAHQRRLPFFSSDFLNSDFKSNSHLGSSSEDGSYEDEDGPRLKGYGCPLYPEKCWEHCAKLKRDFRRLAEEFCR
ncbi:hypothetical protein MTO96_008285 [Rhipicephalus appendiculatus]